MIEYFCTCNLDELNNKTNNENSSTYSGQLNKTFIPDDFLEVAVETPKEPNGTPQKENNVSLDNFLNSKGVHKERKVSNASRKFYENQDKLIAGYEEVYIQKDDKHERSTKLRKKATLYAKVSFAVNVFVCTRRRGLWVVWNAPLKTKMKEEIKLGGLHWISHEKILSSCRRRASQQKKWLKILDVLNP